MVNSKFTAWSTGRSYGLDPMTYWRLASACMSAKKYGDIQPCEIIKLGDRSGCMVTLFGKAFLFCASLKLTLFRMLSASPQSALMTSANNPSRWWSGATITTPGAVYSPSCLNSTATVPTGKRFPTMRRHR